MEEGGRRSEEKEGGKERHTRISSQGQLKIGRAAATWQNVKI
jgi:hypothetical protein